MAAKYPEDPQVVLTTNSTGGDLQAGDVIVCGDSIRILVEDIANGVSGAAYTAGKFTGSNALPANSALEWSDGAALYYDASSVYLTNTSVGTTFAGLAAGAKSAGAATAGLLLGAAAGVLPANAVTTAKIAADAVTGAKIADDAVDSEHIAAGAVDLEHMSANSVDSDQYVDGSVDAVHLAYWTTGSNTVAADELAIPVTKPFVAKTTGADAESLTLANGVAGKTIVISLVVDGGGDGTLTPTTKTGFASIVFADAGDTASLLYVDDTVGWIILGTAGVAAPPAIALS